MSADLTPATVEPASNTLKSVSRSVSMPQWLWDLVDAQGDRSEFLRDLAKTELRRRGLLPGSEENVLISQFAALASDPRTKSYAAAALHEAAKQVAEAAVAEAALAD